MVYFSQLKNCRIIDAKGKEVGYLKDLVFMDGKKQAEVTHFVCCDDENSKKKIPWSFVKDINRNVGKNQILSINLNEHISKVNPFFVKSEDMLVGDLIDKQ